MRQIETQSNLTDAFANIGWSIFYDEVSQPYAEMRVGDRILHALLTKRAGMAEFSFGGWISTDALSCAYTMIFHPGKRISISCPLVNSPEFRLEQNAMSQKEFEHVSQGWVDWGKSLDIDAQMRSLFDRQANNRGNMPARHLAALTAAAKVPELETYKAAFAGGDWLGFVPYIQPEHIDATVAFARQRLADPAWLPESPKLRV